MWEKPDSEDLLPVVSRGRLAQAEYLAPEDRLAVQRVDLADRLRAAAAGLPAARPVSR